jgi:inosine/xanthosine triphosphatase
MSSASIRKPASIWPAPSDNPERRGFSPADKGFGRAIDVIVLLGSTRPAKVDGARDALAAIAAIDERFRTPAIRTFDLTKIAPRMPMSEAEIVDGARRRALALVEDPAFVAGESFAVGLEGGLNALEVPDEELFALHTWAAVTDGVHWGYGAGGAVLIPRPVMARVRAGEELGDVVDSLVGAPTRGTRGAWGVLTRDLVGRRDAFRLAVLAAFAPFYHFAAYR